MTAIAALTEDFTGAAPGTVVSAANTGFYEVTGTGTSTFITDPFNPANRMMQVTATAQDKYHGRNFPATAVLWFGWEYDLEVAPAASTIIALGNTAVGGTKIFDLRVVGGTRTLQLRNISTSIWTSTALADNTKYRVYVGMNLTTKWLRVLIFNADGSTLLQDSTQITVTNAATTISNIQIGALQNTTSTHRFGRLRGDNADAPVATPPPPTTPDIEDISEDFLGASTGTTVGTGNSIFTAVSGAGASVFAVDPVDGGALRAMHITTTANDRSNRIEFNAADTAWLIFDLVIASAPAANMTLVEGWADSTAAVKVFDLRVMAGTRTIQLRNATGVAQWTSTSLDAGVKHRVAIMSRLGATAGLRRNRVMVLSGAPYTALSQDSGEVTSNATVSTMAMVRVGHLSASTAETYIGRIRGAITAPTVVVTPTVSLGTNQTVAAGSTVTVTATTTGSGTLAFSTTGPALSGSGSTRTFTMPGSTTGTSVTVTATYGGASASVTYTADPVSSASVTLGPDQVVATGDFVEFPVTTSGAGTLVLTQTAGPTVVLTTTSGGRRFQMPGTITSGTPAPTLITFSATYGGASDTLSVAAPTHRLWRKDGSTLLPVRRSRVMSDLTLRQVSRARGAAVAPDITAPTVPGTPVATAVLSTVTVTATASTDAVGVTQYEWSRNGSVTATTVTPNLTQSGLAAGVAVSYRVRARDAAGNWSAQSPVSNTVTPTAATVSWAGDPGDGNYYIGWSEGPGNDNLSLARANPGYPSDAEVSIWHQYNGSGITTTTQMDEAVNANMIASITFKSQFSPAQINAGSADAQIDLLATNILNRSPHPFLICYYHEPEDNITTTTDKAAYRSATRRIVNRFRAIYGSAYKNYSFLPIYMCPWTFSSASGRDWRTWHADWTGTTWNDDLTMDLMGHDVYMPNIGSTNMWSFEHEWEQMKAVVEQAGYPRWDYVIPEFGMKSTGSEAPSPVPNWLTWCTAARTYIEGEQNIKALFYWDNGTGVSLGKYSFGATYDPNGTKIQGWNHIIDGSVRWTP